MTLIEYRVIDLSYAAASALDIVRSGTARVEIHAVAEPAAPAKLVSVAPAAVPSALSIAPSERLFAEGGKFRTRTDAVAVIDGPLLDEAEVERMSDRLRELGAKRPRDVVMN